MATWPISQRAQEMESFRPEGPGMRTQDAQKLEIWRKEFRVAEAAREAAKQAELDR